MFPQRNPERIPSKFFYQHPAPMHNSTFFLVTLIISVIDGKGIKLQGVGSATNPHPIYFIIMKNIILQSILFKGYSKSLFFTQYQIDLE